MRNIAFALSLVLIFMMPWEGVIEFPGLGNASKFMGLALAVFWLVTVVQRSHFRRPAAFHVLVGIFVLWNALSIFWSARASDTLERVVTWVQLFGLVYILWDLYNTKGSVLAGLQAYLFGVYVAVGSAVANYMSDNAFYTNYQRFSAEEMNPDGFGFIVALGIPVAWYLAMSPRTGRMAALLRWVSLAYIPTAFVAIALSGTRTALIAAVPGMLYGLASLGGLRLPTRVATLVMLAAVILVLVPFVRPLRSFQRLGSTGAEIAEGDLTGRKPIWRDGLASFMEHPLLGVGSNRYRSVNRVGKVAHNTFLSILVELGLIGLALFGVILAVAVIQALDQPKRHSRFWLAVLAVWIIGASTLTWEHRKTTWLFLSLLTISAAVHRRRDESPAFAWSRAPETRVLTADT